METLFDVFVDDESNKVLFETIEFLYFLFATDFAEKSIFASNQRTKKDVIR